ncbi:uroporphyrinogen-III synthase [Rhodovulum euryhalinum]|uniref:Uroporphyrinogen-III synthase n=2 Tax=Rhodovulum euryhalinum TaxID=35805 RepID=A0A4R2KEE8_9RHOB|nr:uroporphyrinogen-III synthase [Rhodovulum euryhalinum]
MHILLTRPALQAKTMKLPLENMGLQVSLAPILDVSDVDFSPETLEASKAFVVTSVYASLRIAGEPSACRTVPIYAVGAGTAAPLRRAGFTCVHEAAGDATSLLDLILKKRNPSEGRITYLSGWDITEDMARALERHGHDARRVVAYRATPAKSLSNATRELLRRGDIDCIVFMSYRTAHFFTALCEEARLSACLQTMTAAVLSEKVASGLDRKGWRKIRVATAPSQEAMIDILASARDQGFQEHSTPL